MTKSDFIKISKELGFEKYKDLVVALGYHERTIDRYKQDEPISKKIEQSLNDFKNGDTKSTQHKINTTQKNNTKKVHKKTTQKKYTKNQHRKLHKIKKK